MTDIAGCKEALNMTTMASVYKNLRSYFPKMSPVLQEYHFRKALKEIGILIGPVEIDHANGVCWHKKTGSVPIVFPESWIKKIRAFPKIKTKDYFFRGVISPGREWLGKYPDVSESKYGRNPKTKYQMDNSYFESLSASKFGLAPVGECPWSYRFFEAILCDAMPVIGETDIDVFSPNFNFLRHGTEHQYDDELCRGNFATLIEKHTLRGIGF